MTLEATSGLIPPAAYAADGVGITALLSSPFWLDFVNGPGKVILFALGVAYAVLRIRNEIRRGRRRH